MATIRQVANLAGVSTATVSHVLNGTRAVSTPVRERVFTVMDQLRYQPNVVARSLRRQQTMTLGLMVPDIEIPFFARLARTCESAARAAGYSVILCNSGWSLASELSYLNEMLARRVDGLLCITLSMTAENIAPVVKDGVPVVIFERTISGIDLDAVQIDNFQGAYESTAHLLQLGHRRIGCITGLVNSQLNDDRLAGYYKALGDARVESDSALCYQGDYSAASGLERGRALLDLPNPPTAVFAFNDMMAIGVMQAVYERGLRVPDNVAIIGFDGVALTEHTSPPLSTVEQPVARMSRIAIDLLRERISGTAPSEARVVIVEPQLVVRASTVGRAETVLTEKLIATV